MRFVAVSGSLSLFAAMIGPALAADLHHPQVDNRLFSPEPVSEQNLVFRLSLRALQAGPFSTAAD